LKHHTAMQPIRVEKHIAVECAGSTVISLLFEHCGSISNKKLKLALQYGAVWLTSGTTTKRIRRAKKALSPGDKLHLYYDEAILFNEVSPAMFIADEGGYSVWSKPCGMYSQGTKWGDHSAICRWVELQGLPMNGLPQRPTFLVHRLDRATQGLILVAHSKKMASMLAGLFETRQIQKQYRAKISGELPEGLIGKTLSEPLDGRTAKTRILKSDFNADKNETTLTLLLETGRKHQIRKHLAGIGQPIIGDRLYGAGVSELSAPPDLQLVSCFLSFTCPQSHDDKSYQLSE